ncbi:uncharacterized protein LOC141850027 isoform X2 [Brevipalpus obovatus]|uniref:uncharacterized protein LOC141850027 isoform X2 n=1 Tax=Brevipalpus obovatus TaxID=246614 RepID=UPI003D9F20AE
MSKFKGFKIYEKLKIPGLDSTDTSILEDADETEDKDMIVVSDIPDIPEIRESLASSKDKKSERKDSSDDSEKLDKAFEINDELSLEDKDDEDYDDETKDKERDDEEEEEMNKITSKSKLPKSESPKLVLKPIEPDVSHIPSKEIKHHNIERLEMNDRKYDFSKNQHEKNHFLKTHDFDNIPKLPNSVTPKPRIVHHHKVHMPQVPKPTIRTPPSPAPVYTPRRISTTVRPRVTPSPPASHPSPRPIPRFLTPLVTPAPPLSTTTSKLFLLPFGARTSGVNGRYFTSIDDKSLSNRKGPKPIDSLDIDRTTDQSTQDRKDKSLVLNGGEKIDGVKRIRIPSDEVINIDEKVDGDDAAKDFFEQKLATLRSRSKRTRRDIKTSASNANEIGLHLHELDNIESIYEDHPALMVNPPKSVDELLRRLVVQQILDESTPMSMIGGQLLMPSHSNDNNRHHHRHINRHHRNGNAAPRTMLTIDSIRHHLSHPGSHPIVKHPSDMLQAKRVEEIVVNYLAPELSHSPYLLGSNIISYPIKPVAVLRASGYQNSPPSTIRLKDLSHISQYNRAASMSLDEPIEPITMAQYNQLMYNLNNMGTIFSETSSLTGPMIANADFRPKMITSAAAIPETIHFQSDQSLYPTFRPHLYRSQERKKQKNRKYNPMNILRRIPQDLTSLMSFNKVTTSHQRHQHPGRGSGTRWRFGPAKRTSERNREISLTDEMVAAINKASYERANLEAAEANGEAAESLVMESPPTESITMAEKMMPTISSAMIPDQIPSATDPLITVASSSSSPQTLPPPSSPPSLPPIRSSAIPSQSPLSFAGKKMDKITPR